MKWCRATGRVAIFLSPSNPPRLIPRRRAMDDGLLMRRCPHSKQTKRFPRDDNASPAPVDAGIVKWRNQLLALSCLVGFAAFGVFYFRHWVVQKPFGIILFIGEGLTPGRLAPTRAYAGGIDVPLNIDSMPHLALASNFSKDFAAPSGAAAATAIATGVKGNNRPASGEFRAQRTPSLLDLARQAGRATGLVTDGKISNPSLAAFLALSSEPAAPSEIVRALADAAPVDLVLGGGAEDFLPENSREFEK